ncbi:hypothetical protein GHK92_01710 [Nocardioides sp. dk4132]|nr:hypothetical protein [Nocardioides sp. dk4132]QGA09534.1 hypothetical protein GFH29_03155 [Nocardioides sp. dk884]
MVVPGRFCGPPDSGNGGWTAGAVAQLVRPHVNGARSWRAVEVTLTAPPPLDVALSGTEEDGVVVVRHDDTVVARGRTVTDDLVAVPPVSPARAREASAAYPGHVVHPFPGCFVCGPEHEHGLRIFPGPVVRPGPHWWAATWTPDASVQEGAAAGGQPARASLPVTWAALDCIGGWAGDLVERTMVLGRMTARVDTLPAIGEEHVVVAEARGQDGRKVHAATSLYDASGALLATAEQVWIVLEPAPAAR